jgi:hypothetical protein
MQRMANLMAQRKRRRHEVSQRVYIKNNRYPQVIPADNDSQLTVKKTDNGYIFNSRTTIGSPSIISLMV